MTERRNLSGGSGTAVRDQDKVMLRLPDGMRDKLKVAASANNRSMNAEIVARLEETFSPLGKIPDTFDDALQAHGGDVQALLATESVRIRTLLERMERAANTKGEE